MQAERRALRQESATTPLRWTVLSWFLLVGCEQLPASLEGAAPAEAPASADAMLLLARENDKVADDVEEALSERWQGIADVIRTRTRPLASVADVLSDRGLDDPEAGLGVGVFGTSYARRRYFAAVLLGSVSEPAGLTVAARAENARMSSLSAARMELSDVDQRVALDVLARAASDRLHALCERLATLDGSCTEPGPRSATAEHAADLPWGLR